MNKIQQLAQKPYLYVFSVVCIFILLSSFKLGAFNNTGSSKKQIDFPVISLISSLVVVDVKIKDTVVLLQLRNDSDKAITAISLSSSGIQKRSEMIGTDNIIPPGGFDAEQCDLPSSRRPEKGITILAVVYDDGTSDGKSEFVKQIFDVRAGTQAQLARILPLFHSISTTPKTMRLMQKREAIRVKLEQLPEDEEGKSFEYRVGLQDTKELALDKIKQLERIEQEKGEDFARQIIPYITDKYEEKSLLISNSLRLAR